MLRADLEDQIKDVRVGIANMGRDLSREIGDVGSEVSKPRVSMACMAVGVDTPLGDLITLFEFL